MGRVSSRCKTFVITDAFAVTRHDDLQAYQHTAQIHTNCTNCVPVYR